MKTLKAKNLKNKPRNFWKKNGWHVMHLHNCYLLTGYNYSKKFKTISELKETINNFK